MPCRCSINFTDKNKFLKTLGGSDMSLDLKQNIKDLNQKIVELKGYL